MNETASLLRITGVTLGIPSVLAILSVIALLFPRAYRLTGRLLGWFTFAGSLIAFALTFLIVNMIFQVESQSYSYPVNLLGENLVTIDFHIDSLSVFFILLVNTIALAVSWNDLAYLAEIEPQNKWQQPVTFHALVNFFHFTMLLVPVIDNLVGVWIAIELTTVGSAFLLAFERKRSSWEATWKYLIVTSTGIILALLGTIFLANAIPEDRLGDLLQANQGDKALDWTYLMSNAHFLKPTFVWFAFLFALAGYGTKAGLAPMHTWLPDGHGEAPSPVSALLSGVLLKSALYVILRFYTLTNLVLKSNIETSAVLLVIGLLSLIIATPFILKENPFKRVLAYHSLEHMGIITVGLGLGGSIAIFGAILHMFNHAITKALMFLTFGNIMKNYAKHGIDQREITGILRSMPITGAILALGGLALVGTPPFSIFMSEFLILWGGISPLINSASQESPFPKGVIITAIVLFILSTTLIFYGLVKHLTKLVLGKAKEDLRFGKPSLAEIGPLLFLFVIMLVMGIWIYPPLATLIQKSVAIVIQQ